ncbi:MAG TPA: LPS-assembly protein LptD, partial [Sphingomicrobium sp.]
MRKRWVWWTALPMVLGVPATAFAQPVTVPAPVPGSSAPTETSTVENGGEAVDFAADQVSYDSEGELITASGSVRMSRDGNYLAADRVTWNRRSGEVRAEGNVVVVNPEGDKLVGESVVLTDTLRDGSIANLLVVLESGGRIAAARGTRTGNVTSLDNAVYSPCPVTSPAGCPRNPSWSITAARVIHDPGRNQVRFQGGRLQLFGLTLPLLPIFSIGTGAQGGGISGWLVPDISFSSRNGLELAMPYYRRLAPNRDLTLTPHLYTQSGPALEARYRHLDSISAFQLGGFATYSRIDDPDTDDPTPNTR